MCNIQGATRKILLRLTVFILTASAAQVLAHLIPHARNEEPRFMVTTSPTYQTYTPVEVESVPVFDFPKSVPTNRNIDFSVTLSLVAAADGSARNIKVDEASVDAATGQVFYNLHSTTKDKHIDEIEGELVELVTGKIGGTKFKPRTLNGEALPTMVFVNLRFIAGPNACPNVVAEFKTSAGTISYNTVSNPCKHALL